MPYSTSSPPSPSSPQPPTPPSTLLPINPTAAHHDLPTFLAHAQRTGLSASSTVYNGTVYEYLAQETLRRYGFELQRVGGRGDRGVDLVGVWAIPKQNDDRGQVHAAGSGNRRGGGGGASHEILRVLVQCKRLVGKSAKIGPNLVRELDGAVRSARLGFLFDSLGPHYPIGGYTTPSTTNVITTSGRVEAENTATNADEETSIEAHTSSERYDGDYNNTSSTTTNSRPAIGVLVGTRPATKGVIESLRRSNRGLVWIMLEEEVPPVKGTGSGTGLSRGNGETAAEIKGATTAHTIPNSGQNGEEAEAEAQIEEEQAREIHQHGEPVADAYAYADEEINIETDLEHFHISSASSPTPTSTPNPTPTPAPIPKGRIKQIIWNQAARNLGLEGIDVIKRYPSIPPCPSPSTPTPTKNGDTDGNVEANNGKETKREEEVVLSRAGRVILG